MKIINFVKNQFGRNTEIPEKQTRTFFAESTTGQPICLPERKGAWESQVISGLNGTGTVNLSLRFIENQIDRGDGVIFFENKTDFTLQSRLRTMAESAGRPSDFITIEATSDDQFITSLQQATTLLTEGYLKQQVICVSAPYPNCGEEARCWTSTLHIALLDAIRSVIGGKAQKPGRTQVYSNFVWMDKSSLSLFLQLGRAAGTYLTFLLPSLDMVNPEVLRMIHENVPVEIFLQQSPEGLAILREMLSLEAGAAAIGHLASEQKSSLIFKEGSLVTLGWLR